MIVPIKSEVPQITVIQLYKKGGRLPVLFYSNMCRHVAAEWLTIMKKFVTFLLSIAMLLPLLCTNAYAATIESASVFEKACELFPEHADTILNKGIVPYSRSSDTQTRVKVFEETRKYSENQAITYTEFSDGSAYVTSSDFKRTFEQTNSEPLSSYLIRYTCNFSVYATSDRSKKLGINGIKFIIDSLSYDNITSRGSITSDSVSHASINNTWKSWEDSSGHAYASYSADLPDSSGRLLDVSIKFWVGGDSCYITANDEMTTQ